MKKKIRTPKDIEMEFDALVDKRLDARTHRNLSFIENTDAEFKVLLREYLDSVFEKYKPLSEEEKAPIKRSMKSLEGR